MADKQDDKAEIVGWAAPREPKDEPRAPSLTNQRAISEWIAKAAARSGQKRIL